MKMTAEAAEREAEQRAANPNSMNGVIKEAYGDGALAVITAQKPQNACIIDRDGYIACGPIIGQERPADTIKKPWSIETLPGIIEEEGRIKKPGIIESFPGKPGKPSDEPFEGDKPSKPMDGGSGIKPFKPSKDDWIYDLDRPTRK